MVSSRFSNQRFTKSYLSLLLVLLFPIEGWTACFIGSIPRYYGSCSAYFSQIPRYENCSQTEAKWIAYGTMSISYSYTEIFRCDTSDGKRDFHCEVYSWSTWPEDLSDPGQLPAAACAGHPGEDAPPDLSIESVEVGQVAWNPQIWGAVDNVVDLVVGKSATLKIKPKVTGTNLSVNYVVTARIGDQTRIATSADVGFSGELDISKFRFIIPAPLTATIQVSIAKADGTPDAVSSNNLTAIPYMAHSVSPFQMDLVRFKTCAGNVSCPGDVRVSNVDRLMSQAEFLSDTFAVPDNGITITKNATASITDYSTGGFVRNIADLQARKVLTGVNRIFGVVPDDYLIRQLGSKSGGFIFYDPVSPVGFVIESSNAMLAHELTHSFMPDSHKSEEDYTTDATGNSVYSADFFDGINARTGVKREGQRSLLGPEDFGSTLNALWMDPFRHSLTLKTLTLKRVDPAILVISGQISPTGQVSVEKIIGAESGFLSESGSGPVLLRGKNSSGVTVSQVFVKPVFEGHVIGIEGEAWSDPVVTLPAAPFAVAISAEQPIATLEVVMAGKVVQKIEVQSKSLRDAIASIPADALDRKKPENFRKLLLLEVALVEAAVRAKIPKLASVQARILLKQFDKFVNPNFGDGAIFTYDQVRASILMQVEILEAEAKKCKKLFCR